MVNQPTDAELVEQARLCGDKEAFGILLARHQHAALKMARRIVAQEEVARELAQEAMLQAYLSIAALEQPARFQSWLLGIVINICRNYLRQRQINHLSLEALAGGLDATPVLLTSRAPDAHTIAEMRELHELVLAALETLSPANREAVMLFYYEQLSLREISLTLGITMTAVKGRLHKSRRQLADYFNALADRDQWLPYQDAPREAAPRQKGKTNMAEVEIADVVVLEDDKQGFNIIVLLDAAEARILPIWIGAFEGQNIAMYLLQESTGPVPRPMTYEFTANLIRASGATMEEVHISALRESTYYATAMLRVGETVHEIDARPSDAMALALRFQCKIFVAEEIMAKASKPIPEKFKGQLPRKGLEQIMVKMAEAKREHEETMAKFKEAQTKVQKQEMTSVVDRLFAYVFEE